MSRRTSDPAPLTSEEAARLLRWERWMVRYYAAAMVLIAIGGWLLVRYGGEPFVRRLILLGVLGLVIAATLVQFRVRCPRCGTHLGRQTRLLLPPRCKTCRVAFPRPARSSQDVV